jgi:hypothetical protein
MSSTLSAANSPVNPQNSNRPGTCPIGYVFVAVPEAMLEQVDHPTAERVFKVVYECTRRGWFDPPIRYLAARVKRCKQQVLRALAILEASGFIRIIRRKISAWRNDTNVYQIIFRSVGGDKNVTEVLNGRVSTNTKASRPAAPIPIPPSKLQHENDGLKARARWLESKLAAATQKAESVLRYCQRGIQIDWHTGKDQREAERQAYLRVGTEDSFEKSQELVRKRDENERRWVEEYLASKTAIAAGGAYAG